MRVIGYVRVSTETQAKDGYGLDVQRADVRAFCRASGHKLLRFEEDPAVTGTLPDTERPGLLAALKALRDKEADGIVIPSLNRLARLLHVQEAILGKIWQMGAVVFSVDTRGEILADDPDDPMRTAMRQMMGVFAQLDRAMLIKRMRNGRAAKAAGGGFAYGSPALGYRADSKQLVPDDAEQAVLSRIYALAADGMSTRKIAAVLTGEGLRTKRGGQWHSATVARVLARRDPAPHS